MDFKISIIPIFLYIVIFITTVLSYNLNNTKIYGPGLYPDKLVLPVRYFYIEIFDDFNQRINSSVGNVFKVDIDGESENQMCRVWTQVLDRYDGSYIVRYRTYQTCRHTVINVYSKYRHVGGSPFKIKGPVYSENCYCPLNSIKEWKEIVSCPANYAQIDSDLKRFHDVDMTEVLKQSTQRFNQPGSRSLCNYIIKKNEIYRRCYGQHVGFNMFMDNILHSLARKMILPDTEFIINLGDWPLITEKDSTDSLLPVFSWCGSDSTADIVVPTYDISEATLEMMGRVMLDMISVQSNNDVRWSKKKNKGFWRGRDSRRERLDLITLARKHPDLFNVSLTNFFFFRQEEETYGPKSKHESFFKFFDYKYQISIDGTVAAYRFPYLLAGSGVVLKQESEYYEHFYKDLKPYVHYIPFKRDLSDLVEKLNWAKENDIMVEQISKNGRKYAQENLMPEDIFCYHAVLLEEWSKRVDSKIVVREEMQHVPNEENKKRFGNCKCHRLNNHDEL